MDMPSHRLIRTLRFCPVFVGLLACALLVAGAASSQTLDAFDPNADGTVYCILPLPDGKVLVSGNFNTIGGQTRNHLARLNADGSLDTAFNPNLDSQVYCIAALSDGKYMIGGVFSTIGGVSRKYLARLNADGTLDSSFNASIPGTGLIVRALVVQPDGKVIVGGNFTSVFSQTRNRLARLNADGTLDSGFNPNLDGGVHCLARQPDGKILIAGPFSTVGATYRPGLARLNADGTLDTAFTPTAGQIETMALENDGDIIIGGQFTNVNGTTRNRIARLSAAGTLDTGFNPNATDVVAAVSVQTDGKVVVVGHFTSSIGGGSRERFARLNANGSLDTTITASASFDAQCVALDGSGRIYIGGNFTAIDGTTRNRIARFTNNTAAIQTITVTNSSQIDWMRSGSAPELEQASFEIFNGTGWVSLGNASRISGGWRLSGLNIPISGQIRARGRPTGGQNGTSAGLIEQVSSYSSQAVALLPQATGLQTGAALGRSVAVDGNYTVVGASLDDVGGTDSGLVKVFNTTTGALLHVIPNPSMASSDNFGVSVAIHGTKVVAGAHRDDTGATNAGSAYVFDLAGATPTVPVLVLNNPSPQTDDFFGSAVTFYDNQIVVGAPGDNTGADSAGSAYVYDLTSGTPTVPIYTFSNPTADLGDQFGNAVSIYGSRVVVGAYSDNLDGIDSGSVYVYDLGDGTPTVHNHRLKRPTPGADEYGSAVSIHVMRVVAGAPLRTSGTGIAYVYDLTGAVAEPDPVLTLNNPGTGAGDQYGLSVAINVTRVIVGARSDNTGASNAGRAYIYDVAGGTPDTPVATLDNPAAAADDEFGYSVAMSATRAAVGAWQDDLGANGAGTAYVYDWTSGTPTVPTATLSHVSPGVSDNLGSSVAVSGNWMAVGVPFGGSTTASAGRVDVFDLAGGSPSTPWLTIQNPNAAANGSFGISMAMEGSLLVVGAKGDNTGAVSAGRVYVFDLSSGTPGTAVHVINNPDPVSSDNFGGAVAISGTRIVVGISGDDTGAANAGGAYVFDLSGGSPTTPVLFVSNPDPVSGDVFGSAVAIHGTRFVVGAYADDTGGTNAGSAYVFDLTSGTPSAPVLTLRNPSVTFDDDYFGWSVAISGTRVVVGVARDDVVATDDGRVYLYDLASGTPTTPVMTLTKPGVDGAGQFGYATSFSGSLLLVGAPDYTLNATNLVGQAHLFDLGSPSPASTVTTFSNPTITESDRFGYAVALNVGRIGIGAPFHDSISANKGAAYAYSTGLAQISAEEGGVTVSDASTLDLGIQPVGTPLVKTFTIRNLGGTYLSGLAITKDGTNPGDFTLGTPGSVSLAPYASTTFAVTFSPAALGNRSAAIHIASNVSGSTNPFDIVLTGVGSGAYPASFANRSTVPVTSNRFTATGSTINLSLNYAPTTGDELLVVNNTSFEPINGTFSNLANGQTVTLSYGGVNYDFVAYYYGGEGYNDLVLLWKNRRLVAWGYNNQGRLGDNSLIQRESPVSVNTATGTSALDGKTVVSISVGDSHSLALCSDGTVVAWGSNTNGRLGDNSLTDRSVPVAVNAESGISALYGKKVVAVAAGGGFSMALCSDGTLASWGENGSGQLGDNSGQFQKVPVQVNNSSGQSALYGKRIVGIATGYDFAMALCSDGSVAAWGGNVSGQLGDNTLTSRPLPVLVNTTSGTSALFGRSVVKVAAGENHVLALCADGTLCSWGNNGSGKLGDNSTTQRKVPVLVNSNEGVSALFGKTIASITAGQSHSLALCLDGSFVGWGDNGEVGDSTANGNRLLPVSVNAASGGSALIGRLGVSVTAGASHSMSITSDGRAVGWGNNAEGQLGIGVTTGQKPPTLVLSGVLTAVERFVSVESSARAMHNIAIVAAPPVYPEITVEENGNTLTDGSSMVNYGTALLNSTGVSKTFTIRNVGGGTLSGLALSKDGANAANYTVGALGVTTLAPGASTTFTVTLSGSIAGAKTAGIHVASDDADEASFDISLSGDVSAVLSAVYAGANQIPITMDGGIPSGTTVSLALAYTPVTGTNLMVLQNSSLNYISGAFDNLAHGQTVVLSHNGYSYSFVANYYGGSGNDLVLVWRNNRAYAWGVTGALGNTWTTNSSVNRPDPVWSSGVLAGKTIVSLAAGDQHSLALCSDGTLVAWGSNGHGQVGDNSGTFQALPVLVNSTSGTSAVFGKTVVAISAGQYHSLAVCSDGTVVSWGNNANGQLGINSTDGSNVPVAVNTTTGVSALFGKVVVAVAAGHDHSLALCSDGTLAAWGRNDSGQLGDNTVTQRLVPTAVNRANGISALFSKTVISIACGAYHSMALCSDGTVCAWGNAGSGQIGNGNSSGSNNVPVAVSTSTGISALYGKTVTSISVGGFSSRALCSDGTLTAWGNNTYGQLGDNTISQRPRPVIVNADFGFSALYGKAVISFVAGLSHSLALAADGTVAAWGDNGFGQVGDNTTTQRNTPVSVDLSTLAVGERVSAIFSGPYAQHSMAIVAAAPQPAGVSLAASAITLSDATLNGTANANGGSNVAVTFEYGPTTAYGGTVSATPGTVSGAAVTPVSAAISGLAPGALYHYRVVVGGIPGEDMTLTTVQSSDATLAGLTLSSGTLAPAFAAGTTQYTVGVQNSTTTLSVTPSVAQVNATVTVNGVPVASGVPSDAIPLTNGSNTVTIVVTAQNTAVTRTYSLTVIRDAIQAVFSSAADIPLSISSLTATGIPVNISLNYAPTPGTDLRIVNNTGLPFIQGTFSNLAQGQTVALPFGTAVYNFVANYYGGTGNDLVLVWAKNRLVGWGKNEHGQIGDGSISDTPPNGKLLPVTVDATGVLAGKTVLSVASGDHHSLAVLSDGTVAAWGRNAEGELGDNTLTERTTPVLVNTSNGVSALYGKQVVAVAAGDFHSLALCSDGTVAGWGFNQNGQIGDGSSMGGGQFRSTPKAVVASGALSGKTVVAISAGGGFSSALCSDGTVVTWGSNGNGNLGNNSTTRSNVPVAVDTSYGTSALFNKKVVKVAAGGGHMLVLCDDGTLAAWGWNQLGMLGDNSTTDRLVPVAVNIANGTSALFGKTVSDISAGYDHSLVACADGTLAAWGWNYEGPLGDNSSTQRIAPVAVSAAAGTSSLFGRIPTKVYAKQYHSLALFADGEIASWGKGQSGQLGNNSQASQYTPVLVTRTSLAVNEKIAAVSHGGFSSHTLAIVASPPPPPTVTTLAATSITGTSAVLNGTINANGSGAAASFDHGTSTGYGSNVAAIPAVVTGDTNVPVTATLTGLQPGTQYFFRARGTDTVGIGLSFTTLSADANLASLTLSSGSLSPVFDAGTLSYTASVGYRSYSLTVTPTKAQANATITVNGVPVNSSAASGSIPLSVGPNVITTVVTAQDGTTTKTYTVTVTRAAAAPGDVEEAFSTPANAVVYALAVQPDGQILVGGEFGTLGAVTRQSVGRLQADGMVDAFNPVLDAATVSGVHVLPNGQALLGGGFNTVNGSTRKRIARVNANGSLDAAFGDSNANSVSLFGLGLLPDNKVLVGGLFTQIAGVSRNYIARLNTDATLDSAFDPGLNFSPFSFAWQADGKLLLAGEFSQVGGQARNLIARVYADGSLDTGFDPNGSGGAGSGIYALAVQADGKMVIGGSFSAIGGTSRARLARLNMDGTLDMAFNPGADHDVYTITLQADGKILIGGQFTVLGGSARNRVARLNADGTLDSSFNPDVDGIVRSLAMQADGQVLMGGEFMTVGGAARNRLARLVNQAATQSLAATSHSRVEWTRGGSSPEAAWVTFEVSTDGGTTWMPLGMASRINGGWEMTGLGLPSSGQLRGRARVSSGLYNSSSGLVETVATFSGLAVPDIAVFNGTEITAPNERTDNTGTQSFGTADLASVNTVQTFSIRNDGTVALSGLALSIAGSHAGDFTLGSLGATTLEPGASTSFSVTFSPQGFGARNAVISLASNDFDETPFEIAVSGTGGNALAASFLAANTIPLTTNGFTASGSSVNFTLNFSPAAFSTLTVLNNTSANPISGVFSNLAQAQTVTLSFGGNDYRYFADYFGGDGNDLVLVLQGPGVLDYTFGTRGKVISGVPSSHDFGYSALSQPDGKILVVGTAGGDFSVMRFLQNGTPDESFGTAGKVLTSVGTSTDIARCVVLQRDGKIIVGGRALVSGSQEDFALVRYLPNGSLDLSFGTGGIVITAVSSNTDVCEGIAVQSDGKIVAAGYSWNGAKYDAVVARYLTDGTLDEGFGTSGIVITSIGSGDDQFHDVGVQKDGKLVAAGYSTQGTYKDFAVVRYLPNGDPDDSFGSNGKVTTAIGSQHDVGNQLVLQPDGKILVAGSTSNGSNSDFAIVRYTSTGLTDSTFDGDGRVTTNFGGYDEGNAIALQNDGKILVSGRGEIAGKRNFAIARYQENGMPDASFHGDGLAWTAVGTGEDISLALAVQVDGKIVSAGYSMQAGDYADFATVRYLGDSALSATFASPTDVPLSFAGLNAAGKSISFTLGFTPAPGTRLKAFDNTSSQPISSEFENLAQGQTVTLNHSGTDYSFVANYFGGDGNDLTLEWANTKLAAFGDNQNGQLGITGTATQTSVPTQVVATAPIYQKTILSMSAGQTHSLAVCSDGTVAAWGSNANGQLGNGSTTSATTPVAAMMGGVLSGKKVIAVAAGGQHSLVLCSDGTLAAWGDGSFGQIGDGGVLDRHSPVLVSTAGALSGKRVIAISAGANHSAAICSDGSVVCWGANTNGELGNGSNTQSNVPVAVTMSGVLLGRTVVAVACGQNHTLALLADGAVAAWGLNTSGQLGNGSTTASNVPVLVSTAGLLNGKRVVEIAAGGSSSLARSSDGVFASWGLNDSGQLGVNSATTSFTTPQPVLMSGVLSGKTVTRLFAGEKHAGALCSDGTLSTWGEGTGGELGNNTIVDSSQPVLADTAILGGTDVFVQMSSGASAGHSLALIGTAANVPNIQVGHLSSLLVDGSTQSFGSTYVTSTRTKVFTIFNNGTQVLNGIAAAINGTAANIAHYSIPAQPPTSLQPGEAASFSVNFTPTSTGSKPVTLRIANNLGAPLNPFDVNLTGTASPSFTFTFTAPSDVAVNSTAFNASGKTITLLLGHVPATGSSLMVVNNTGPGFISGVFSNLAQGQTVALTFNSITYNFVANYFGGNGNDLVLNWKDTRLMAWGANSSGTLGTGSTTQANTPVAVNMSGVLNGKTIVSLASGERHSLALCADNTLAAWGANDQGQLGTGNTTPSTLPVAVSMNGALTGKTIAAIAAGYDFSLALCSDGTVAAWGTNGSGQLGNNSLTGSNTPVAVSAAGVLSGKVVTGIAAGYDFSAARCADGMIVAWGANHSGQLGNGTNDDSLVPAAVTASGVLSGRTVTSIAAGNYFVLALCSDGRIAAWGDNGFGTLGDGTVDPSNVPVLVSNSGLFAGKTPVRIAAGQYHSTALCGDGTLGVWGDNTIGPGQLGVSGTDSYLTPGPVNTVGVLAGKTISSVAVGQNHNIALLADGTLAAWGFSAFGQLGNGNTTYSEQPVLVNLSAVAAGERILQASSGNTAQHTVISLAMPVASGGAPAVTTNSAESINKTTATLKGLVNPNGAATDARFDYGLTTSYGTQTAIQAIGSGSNSVTVTQNLTGLLPNTTYHYRVIATNSGGSVQGNNLTFTTLPDPPVVVNGTASGITNTGAIINGSVNPNTRATTAYFRVSTDPAFVTNSFTTAPQNVSVGSSFVSISAPLSGLLFGTTYYYRLVAQNAAGEAEDTTAQSFTTTSVGIATQPPTISSTTALNLATTSARLQGSVNPNGGLTNVFFEYGPAPGFGTNSINYSAGSGTAPQTMTHDISGLLPATQYQFRLIAENNFNNSTTTTGATFTFTTLPLPPIVETHAAAALSTTSARLNGKVNAQNGSAVATFEWGTDGVNFPNSLTATPSPVTGSTLTEVSVDLANLAQFTTYHFRVKAVSAGGTTTGSVLTFQPAIISGLTQQFPNAPSASNGSLTVTLAPTGLLSGWRFVGEHRWRASGDTATGLVLGSRVVEFRPVPGYLQPGTDTVNVASAGQTADYEYYATPSAGTGGILVLLKPDTLAQASNVADRGQWRLLGETAWRDSATTASALPAGSYLVECKAVSGYSTPVLVNIAVSSGQTVNPTIVYADAFSPAGTPPAVVSFSTVSTDATKPYGYVGQIRSNSGVGTGFAVKSRVVATAAHVVFDEGSQSSVQGLQWLPQEDAGGHEPLPVTPRGYYLIDGYATQRATETPGSFSLASRQKDVAALYFINDTDAARNGFAGFLASDLTNNEFLLSSAQKMLVGYPVDGIATLDQGRMHATPAANLTFTGLTDRVFATTGIRSTGGNSGGPMCVQHTNGNWYPAAIYLGGATQSIVRAIDSTVIQLFNTAQQSGIDDQGYTGGGITHTGYTSGGTASTGALRVNITPAGTGWRPVGSTKAFTPSGISRAGLTPGTFSIEFTPLAGYQTPAAQSVTVVAASTQTYSITYQSSQTPQETWRQAFFGTTANTGNAADSADPDGDGFTNAQEYAAGTNPTLNGDFFKVTESQRTASTFSVSTAGKTGRTYTLQRSTNLISWTNVTSQGPLTNDAVVTLEDLAMPSDAAFYRIVVTGP